MSVSELIVLSAHADNKMQEDNEIFAVFNVFSDLRIINNVAYFTFDDQDWYNLDTYDKIDKRLNFLCSLELEDYAYIRVEDGEDPVYGGDVEKYGVTINDPATTS